MSLSESVIQRFVKSVPLRLLTIGCSVSFLLIAGRCWGGGFPFRSPSRPSTPPRTEGEKRGDVRRLGEESESVQGDKRAPCYWHS